jgi:hypothetical protein
MEMRRGNNKYDFERILSLKHLEFEDDNPYRVRSAATNWALYNNKKIATRLIDGKMNIFLIEG